MFEELLDALSPETLRKQLRGFDEEREAFLPRVLETSSYEEMMDELGRFVGTVQGAWFRSTFEWPRDRCVDIARNMLNHTVGDGLHPRSGEFAALKMCRHGDRGGMRQLLDRLGESLQAKALNQYLDIKVLPEIQNLEATAQLRLAEEYLRLYPDYDGLEKECAASIALRWRQVIHQHAQSALAGSTKKTTP